jgi:hypothetical protein
VWRQGAMMSVSFVTKDLGKARIERELKAAKKLVALVGIPSDAKRHEDNPNIGLAQIAYIMEKGSAVNNIPARPFMHQTSERNEKRVLGLSKKLLKNLSNGSTTAMDAIKKLGVTYEGAMKRIFIEGSFAPNALSTIRKKKSSRPLIDTSLLRQSITFKVAKV